jgi:Domain of unknown function (DUF4347)
MASLIVAIDGNSDVGGGHTGLIAQLTEHFMGQLDKNMAVVTVYSVRDMVQKVSMAAGADKISRLTIYGHGSSGFQCVGCGTLGVALKNDLRSEDFLEFSELDGKLKNNAEQYLSQLVHKLSADAVVSLGGCQVGAAPFGDKLLKRMSEVLGVPVEAGTDNQRPLLPGYEGNVVRCSGNLCLTMAASWTY